MDDRMEIDPEPSGHNTTRGEKLCRTTTLTTPQGNYRQSTAHYGNRVGTTDGAAGGLRDVYIREVSLAPPAVPRVQVHLELRVPQTDRQTGCHQGRAVTATATDSEGAAVMRRQTVQVLEHFGVPATNARAAAMQTTPL